MQVNRLAHLNTIRKITLVQFKNYGAATFNFEAPITCITGTNGSGKTNLLDAVYYLCYTKSYFTAYQQNNMQHGTDGFRVEGVFLNENGKDELISCKWKAGKKELFADGVECEKISDHIGKYAAVMIAPDDIELINDGSELRRKWIDSVLSQVDKQYLEYVLQYQKLLQQRNAWLKMNALRPSSDDTQLEYYSNRLTGYGDYIFERRKAFIENFTPLLGEFYRQLSNEKESVSITYESDLHSHSLGHWLETGLQHDLRFQRTLRGIHKDDLDFNFNGKVLKSFGSQGQKKTYLFALKLAQYAYLSGEQGHKPVLLLDDIFEKLDQDRMKALLKVIRSEDFAQVILTDTHEDRVKEAFGADASLDFIRL